MSTLRIRLPLLIAVPALLAAVLLSGCGNSEIPGQVGAAPGTASPQPEEPPCLAI